MELLSFEDRCLVEKECGNCVKFRGDHCLVLNEFYCLLRNSKSCFAKETSLFAWKKTLLDILEHNEVQAEYIQNEWIFEELKRLEKKMSSEIDQCRYENEHKPIRKAKSESGRDKTYKRKRGRVYHSKGEFPDLER